MSPEAGPPGPESHACNSAQGFPQSGENSVPGRPGRRAFLAAAGAAGLALLAGACGGDGGALGGRSDGALGDRPAPSAAPPPPPPTAPAGPAAWIVRGPATPDRVALTFHTDGDLGLAGEILGVLRRAGVPMTAFVVGQWLAANPDWAKRLIDDGHELANHTYDHPVFAGLPPEAMRDQIVRTRDLLVRLTGSPGRLFRPSGTANGIDPPPPTALAAAGAAGYRTVLGYDVDPVDYQSPPAPVLAQRTLAGIGPGSVVSLHFGYPNTLAALPAIIDGLRVRRLTPVTASALLGP